MKDNSVDSTIENILVRLEAIKDFDPHFAKVLNDTYDALHMCHDELKRLRMHNNNLMNVIYQNQGAIEDAQ